MTLDFLAFRLPNHRGHSLIHMKVPKLSGALALSALMLQLLACTPKKVDLPIAPPPNLFDYSRSDLEGLVEFANRFGTLPDSAKIAICREMELSEKERKSDPRGLTLHQAAGQIFLSNCSSWPTLQDKLKEIAENLETPAGQKQFASLSLQLILRQESQTNTLLQAQKKARTKSSNNGTRRKPESAEAPAIDDSPKATPPAPLSDDVARKKLEAIRNLEKSMDRTLKP